MLSSQVQHDAKSAKSLLHGLRPEVCAQSLNSKPQKLFHIYIYTILYIYIAEVDHGGGLTKYMWTQTLNPSTAEEPVVLLHLPKERAWQVARAFVVVPTITSLLSIV